MILLKKLHLFFDFLLLNIALILTYYLFSDNIDFFSSQDFRVTTLFANLLWVTTLLYSSRIYTQFEYSSFIDEAKKLAPNYLIYAVLFYALTVAIFRNTAFPISFYCGIFLIFMLLARFFIKYAVSYKTLNYITIGYCDALFKIEDALQKAHRGKTNCTATFGNLARINTKTAHSADDIISFLEKNKINLILYVSNSLHPDELQELMHYAKHHFIEFKIIPIELDYFKEIGRLDLHNGVFLSAKDEFFRQYSTQLLKRSFDFIFSALVIVFILSWLFPLICLLIVIESKGTPIFLQDRVGYKGRIFKCIKFRSMTVRENGSDVEQAKQYDGRVTKIGAFLRKSNLDEMPQFFNVLIGEMSVVGPRPHAVSHDIQFKNTAENYILRHYTKPGITGWAQVNGWRGPTDTTNKINGRTNCDLWYLKNRSFILDLKIIFLTIFGSKTRQNAF